MKHTLHWFAISAVMFTGCGPPEIETSTLPKGVVGIRYNGQLKAGGGIPPYLWKLGEVPAELGWLSLDQETGVLGGVPVKQLSPGVDIRVTVTDRVGRVDTANLTISVELGKAEPIVAGIDPGGLATNSYAVAWPDRVRDTINLCSLTDTRCVVLADHSRTPAGAIATDKEYTYWLSLNEEGGDEYIAYISNVDSIHTIPEPVFVRLPMTFAYSRGIAISGKMVMVENLYGLASWKFGGGDLPAQIFMHADASGAPFAMDETGVYVDDTGERGAIYYCEQYQCENARPLLSPLYMGVLAARAGVLYLANNDGIYSCPATGCASNPTKIAESRGSPIIMRVDESALYWMTSDEAKGAIHMCPLPDCSGGPRTIAVDQPGPVGLVITDQHVIWANAGPTGQTGAGSILRLER